MITTRRNKKIFIKNSDLDLSPRIVSKRVVNIESNNNNKEKKDSYEVLTVEIACYIDQRKLLEEEVKDIKVFTSDVPLEKLKVRRNLFNESLNPTITNLSSISSLYDTNIVKKTDARKQTEEQRSINNRSNTTRSTRDIISNLNSVIYDSDGLNQGLTVQRFSALTFLTQFNVNEFLASVKIKNIQDVRQSDEELFGFRKVFRVKRQTTPQFRKLSGRTKSISADLSKSSAGSDSETPSVTNFRQVYFREIKQGRDPLTSFSKKDDQMSVEDRLRGTKSIKKSRETKIKECFLKIAENRLGLLNDESLGFNIVQEKISNRNRICRTTFEITRPKIRKLEEQNGSINLIFYAYDKEGRRIDSYGQTFSTASLFLTEINPTLDFEISASRTGNDAVISKIKNEELHSSYFNVYQKSFTRSQNYKNSIFDKTGTKIPISLNNSVTLFEGKNSSTKKVSNTKTNTVFQRVTSYFENRELSNTKSASVASKESPADQMTCSVFVIQDNDPYTVKVIVTNLSEDVCAILPVKRVAKGTRGNDFQPLRKLVDTTLLPVEKVFITEKEDSESLTKGFTFKDNDVEDGVIYEYSAFLFNRSGHKQLSGSRFLEKSVRREELIQVEVKKSLSPGSSLDRNTNTVSNTVKYTLTLNRLEDDVDKIINSIFGDNRALFNNDLASIKDASNLIYGVRVHKIDTLTGDYSFVGSFRGFKQENSLATASTDIPKTYRVEFTDQVPALNTQIYKFDPFIIPPAQILDKVFHSLENIVKNSSRSASTLNRILVSKQKILNKNVISQIGSKNASASLPVKGAIITPAALLEKNKNDLFLEGLTGDIVYDIVSTLNENTSTNLEITNTNVSLVRSLDRNSRDRNYIPKKLADIQFSARSSDQIIDFYIVVKKINKDPNIILDGAIHSRDTPEERSNYRYLTEIKTNVGLVRYYLFGVNRNGVLLGPQLLGSIMLEGE